MQITYESLTDEESFLVERLESLRGIDNRSLRDACGDDWTLLDSPTKFGRKVKALVRAGHLNGVRLEERAANNHQHYSFGS